jgi:hypothetical protein
MDLGFSPCAHAIEPIIEPLVIGCSSYSVYLQRRSVVQHLPDVIGVELISNPASRVGTF